MRMTICEMGATMAILLCLCFLAAGQDKGGKPKPSPAATKIEAMRHQADTNARALATAVQMHMIETGTYNPVLSDYAKEMGGTLPINPCTGTRTGYGLTVIDKHHSAIVAAFAGTKCGKWTPERFKLTQ